MPVVIKFCQPTHYHIILISLTALSCIVALISVFISFVTKEEDVINLPLESFEIPKQFAVHHYFDTPSKEECSNLHNSWIFAFTSLLESFYRKTCIEKGQLPETSYVPFSESYAMSAFKKYCESATDSRFCTFPNSPFSTKNGAISTIPEFFRKSEQVKQSAVPYSLCPNDECSSESEFVCANYPNKDSILEYNFSVDEYAQNSKDIKNLLIYNQKPIMFQMPEPLRPVYTRCDSYSDTKEIESCENKKIRCPDHLLTSDKNGYLISAYCNMETSKSYTGSGEFFVPDDLIAGPPMNFLLVGYTDSFIPSKGKANVNYMKYSKGGFIAKSSHSKDIGHSINYYLGLQSTKDEFKLCPSLHAPQHWIGIDPDRYASDLDLDIVTHLECINSSLCNTTSTYYIARQMIRSNDLYLIKSQEDKTFPYIIEKTAQGTSNYIKYTNKLFENLDDAFLPIDLKDTPSSDLCGYWFIPYDLVDRMELLNRDITSRTIAVSASVTFSDSSMPNKGSSSRKKLINENIKQIPERAATTI